MIIGRFSFFKIQENVHKVFAIMFYNRFRFDRRELTDDTSYQLSKEVWK